MLSKVERGEQWKKLRSKMIGTVININFLVVVVVIVKQYVHCIIRINNKKTDRSIFINLLQMLCKHFDGFHVVQATKVAENSMLQFTPGRHTVGPTGKAKHHLHQTEHNITTWQLDNNYKYYIYYYYYDNGSDKCNCNCECCSCGWCYNDSSTSTGSKTEMQRPGPRPRPVP